MISNIAKGSSLVWLLLAGSAMAAPAPAEQPLSWYPRALLSSEQQAQLPAFCSGMYVTPNLPSIDGDQIELEADSSSSDAAGAVYFRGDVVFSRQGQRLTADEADWFRSLNEGEFRGQVRYDSKDLVLQGERATLSQADGQRRTDIIAAEYALPSQHLRGQAEQIRLQTDGTLKLDQASFTYCEPGQNDWDIRASELTLDQQSGMGSAWHTRLRLAGVPVFYLPYYRFPIDDRRMTGFLNPEFSLNENLQAEEIRLPFYLNLAPNLDATITPHHILDRGLLWESQLRHKTESLGDGELNYAYLNKDATEKQERWGINYRQSGTLGEHWRHSWVYNNVSDGDYLKDMNPGGAIDRTTHLPRRGEINYQRGDVSFRALGESFQTLDDNIALRNRPYRRLPQLELNYEPLRFNQWQWQGRVQYSHFHRDQEAVINEQTQSLSGADALNAHRWVADTALSYPLFWPYAVIEPKAEFRYRYYRFSGPEEEWLATAEAPDEVLNYGVARYSLDAEMFFERPFDWFSKRHLQTLEPRLLWVKSPYQNDQLQVPNFDTAATTVSYASLFSGDRFTGDDRLADLDQLSLGLTSRWLNHQGEERLRASLGRIYYQQDRRVQLTASEAAERATSSTLAEVEWSPLSELRLYSTLEWDPYQDFARQQRFGLRLRPSPNRLFNLGWNTDKSYRSDSDEVITNSRQLDAGLFWSVNDRWALVGRLLRDLRDYDDGELRPVNPVLEAIAGVEYQNCCWRVQLLYRETSPTRDDFSDGFSTDKDYSFMLRLQLKGLGAFGSGTDDLLTDSILGYSRRQYHDY
ncbi:LPS-assembly protein LptD [Bacterioplanes sanyensis]|uniref:LPS-assembly protein LptD n=1 Tax=Bacterioplanes sanyensis TaxID=1249553 RepID=UPI00167268EC|nr:LPS assembly protein LptD [Bacterioplanes sanyensis]GGY36481.1 LPS-assembly protein LptD [Bacterioplanes sanyensis]